MRVPMRSTGADQSVLARKGSNAPGVKALTHRAEEPATTPCENRDRRISGSKAKFFPITKDQVWEAYKQVKVNRGAAGVDGITLPKFEENLKDNLYKLWNRMASGSYMPSAVKRVEIPKSDGGIRPLGIPTVEDRIAQAVVKEAMESKLEAIFHEDSYGYRPGKSAHQALGKTRERCWKYDWVVELDIKSFFDNIDHHLLLKAVKHHFKERWIVLYVKRWLKSPIQKEDDTLEERTTGTPQGAVISPLLANLFLHYVFDMWMKRKYPTIPFERFADDVVCHCKTQTQAQMLVNRMNERFKSCGLELHPQKTRIVYCKDDNRQEEYPEKSFDFLGYTFRPRVVKTKIGKIFVNFSPAISNKASKAIRQETRRWRLPNRTRSTLQELAHKYNPIIRGWINYFGAFSQGSIIYSLKNLDRKLSLWLTRKYKRFHGFPERAWHFLCKIATQSRFLFAHWPLVWRKVSMGKAV